MMLKYLKLDPSAWLKVLEHGLFVGAGSVLTYLVSNVGIINFGVYTPVVVSLLTVLSSFVHKVFVNDPTPPVNG